ncbi:MAG: hypothetical protein VX836_15060 [Pseudomonadota bacterium]|nr:hypothetical protein [Pseudomonadota bacterium]
MDLHAPRRAKHRRANPWPVGIQRQGCRERGYRYSYGGYAHSYPNCESLRAGDRRNWQEQCRHGCIHC